jgi:hypothetical protein
MARAWIETHYKPTENRTEWRVVVDGDVIHTGDVDEDVTGMRAHEQAQQWATCNGVTLESWKHAVEHGIYGDLRSRTATDRTTPVRLYGWAVCTNGEGREGVGVSPQQMHDLVAGALPCPVCGEGCGATIEPTVDVATFAVMWNGTRWH